MSALGTGCVTDTKKGLCNSSIYFICQKFLVLLLGVKHRVPAHWPRSEGGSVVRLRQFENKVSYTTQLDSIINIMKTTEGRSDRNEKEC